MPKTTLKEKVTPIVRNLREAAEFAPAVKANSDALVEMLNSSEEFLLASQLLLNPAYAMEEDRPTSDDPDEMVKISRSNMSAAANKIEEYGNVGLCEDPSQLDNIVAASEEILKGVRAFVTAA